MGKSAEAGQSWSRCYEKWNLSELEALSALVFTREPEKVKKFLCNLLLLMLKVVIFRLWKWATLTVLLGLANRYIQRKLHVFSWKAKWITKLRGVGRKNVATFLAMSIIATTTFHTCNTRNDLRDFDLCF